MNEFYPYTLMGESGWKDYDVSSDVFIETDGFAFVMGRIGGIAGWSEVRPPGYWLKVQTSTGLWELRTMTKVLASGSLTIAPDQWHTLRLSFVTLTPDLIKEGVEKLGRLLPEALSLAPEHAP